MAKCEHPNCNNEVTEYTKKGVLKRHCSTTCCARHNSLLSREKASITLLNNKSIIKVIPRDVKCLHPECNKFVHEFTKSGKLKLYCSTICCGQHNSLKSREKAKATMIKNHGVEHNMLLSACIEKRKIAFFEKHGVTHQMHLQTTKDKIKHTCNTRYSVDNPMQSPLIKDILKANNLNNHGVEWAVQRKDVIEKSKKTLMVNFGVETPFASADIVEKAKQTNLENLGVENPFQSPEIQEKIKQTNFYKYGNICAVVSVTVRRLISQTMIRKYNVEYPFQSPFILNKAKQTILNNIGVTNPFESPDIQLKAKATMLALYDVEYSMQSEEIKRRMIENNLIIYGTTSFNNKHIPYDILQLTHSEEWLKSQNETKSLEEIAYDLSINPLILSRRFKQFNIPVKHHAKSFFEKQVFEFVKSIYPNIIQNDRRQIKPYELDIYFPLLNLAIECNGRYFHQDQEREQNKINLCQEKNIDLYFIWDDEWYSNTEYWKQYIQNIIYTKLN